MSYDRIKEALDVLVRYGQTDGDHHKTWIIDQTVRCLTGCPKQKRAKMGQTGIMWEWEELGESEEYKHLITEACAGDGGRYRYFWDTGIAP
jgi:hypothetical protein